MLDKEIAHAQLQGGGMRYFTCGDETVICVKSIESVTPILKNTIAFPACPGFLPERNVVDTQYPFKFTIRSVSGESYQQCFTYEERAIEKRKELLSIIREEK